MTSYRNLVKLDWGGKTVVRFPHKFDPITQYAEWWAWCQYLKSLNSNIVYGSQIIMAFDSDQEAVEFKLKYL